MCDRATLGQSQVIGLICRIQALQVNLQVRADQTSEDFNGQA